MADIVLMEHADGVYLNMPGERYYQDWALGYSSIKSLSINPLDWWWHSPFNTIEPPPIDVEEAKHFRMGHATHVALLEGTDGRLDTYEQAYGVCPSRDDFPHALVTVPQIQDALRLRGQPTSGNKPDLIRRLSSVAPHIEILDALQEAWRMDGLREVTAQEDRRIRLLHGLAHASREEFQLPHGEVETLRGAFMGGLAEVSVFWTDADGIRQRARFDKLKPQVTIDLKTFANWKKNVDFDTSLLDEVKNRKYMIQVAHYNEARRQLRLLVDQGLVFGGSPEQRELLTRIADWDEWAWLWVFAVTSGYPHMKGVRPDTAVAEDTGRALSSRYEKAIKTREEALAKFVFYRERFGLRPGAMWLDTVPIWEPTEEDWGFFS